MTRLAFGLACLILAALFAALAYILARPRWGWERPTVDEVERNPDGEPIGPYTGPGPRIACYSTGSPPSVTSRAWNGTIRDSDKPEFV